jgi:3-hydroxybutyryl-CoA dehydrogenase
MSIETAVVIGTGMMGPGIAATLCLGGIETILVSRTEQGAAAGREKVGQFLLTLDNEGVLPQATSLPTPGDPAVGGTTCQAVLDKLSTSSDLTAAVKQADLVIESTPENLEHKRSLFQLLDSRARETAILASNTSALSITLIAERCSKPERVATTHFWNPPYLIPLVEIVRGERTSESVVETLRLLLVKCRKTPVVVRKDRPGQLGNRLQHALLREAIYIIEQGIASAEDVDQALKNGMALRLPAYGLLEHQDMVGLDLALAVQASVTPDLCSDPVPGALLRELVERGQLGEKTGSGFYDWSRRDPQALIRRRDECVLHLLKLRDRAYSRD